jgi:hypothetical protein
MIPKPADESCRPLVADGERMAAESFGLPDPFVQAPQARSILTIEFVVRADAEERRVEDKKLRNSSAKRTAGDESIKPSGSNFLRMEYKQSRCIKNIFAAEQQSPRCPAPVV